MNSDNTKISNSIDKAITEIGEAEKTLVNIKNKLNTLDIDLNDNKWTGSAKEKCRKVNEMLILYNNNFEPIMESISDAVKQLDQNAQNFSTKTKII